MARPLETKMYWEWNWPTFWSFETQIEWFSISLYTQHDGDHSPGIHFSLIIANLKLIDCGYYNTHHEPDDPEDEA